MRTRYTPLLVLAFFTMLNHSNAQDVHFSQSQGLPLYTNPAMTGFFDGQVRVGGIFRTQNFTVKNNAGTPRYDTYGAYVDASLLKGRGKKDYLGIGVAATYDRAGVVSVNTTNILLNIAYSKGFGRRIKHSIALGLQGEFLMKGIKTNGAQFSDGINENLGKTSSGIDAGVGLRYHVNVRSRFNFFVAGAYTHILQAKENFINGAGAKRAAKITAQAGAVVDITDKFNLIPSFIFTKQGSSMQSVVGTYAQYVFGFEGDERNGIAFGLWTRITRPYPDAIIAGVRLDFKGLQTAFTYDFNISQLSPATSGQGAAELSVAYIINTKRNRRGGINCPRF
jgi:type IX secretion system PorP/SprF family membrane protein